MVFENREFYKNIFFVFLISEWSKIGYFAMLMKNTLTLFERVFFYFATAIFLKKFFKKYNLCFKNIFQKTILKIFLQKNQS